MTEPTARRRWSHGALPVRVPKISRAACLAADELKCKPRTVQHYIADKAREASAIIRAYVKLGDVGGLERFLRPMRQAEQGAPPAVLSNALILDKADADSEEDVARTAYLLTRGPVERDTEIKRLRKEAAFAGALADALQAVRSQ